jgi:hypothetical protein
MFADKTDSSLPVSESQLLLTALQDLFLIVLMILKHFLHIVLCGLKGGNAFILPDPSAPSIIGRKGQFDISIELA